MKVKLTVSEARGKRCPVTLLIAEAAALAVE